ncbi:gliding motility-associated C-terminal domain-containing protein [Dyadobacter luticola]|nr:gliding motility-associated C-terminal domain-containing protein [Dyadobacter luticola]
MSPRGGGNKFKITLIQFWDKNHLIESTPTSSGNRDDYADLYIYRKRDNAYMTGLRVNYINSETISYQNKACAVVRSLNTSKGIYEGDVTLDPQIYNDPDGYYVAWERCCRNADINNIVAPGDNGMVFYLEFPPVTIADSAPEFYAPNGQYICINRPFSMTMSATDADGDELRYSLVTPFRGTTDPQQPFGTKTSKSSYPTITWETGISLASVIPGSSPLKVSNTGILSVTANHLGLYVFTVQCEEYRAGKRIGVVRRDFQLLVIDCNDDQPEQPVITMQASPVQEVTFCPASPVQLETESSSDWSYQWQLNGLNIPGATNATITVTDSGSYSVVKSYTKKCSRDTSSQVVIAHYAAPIEAVISSAKDTLCQNESVNLLANGGTLKPGESISWTRDNVALEEKAASLTISTAGTYYIEIKNGTTGCAGRDTLRIEQETLTVTLPAKKGIIETSKTTLTPLVTPPNPSYSYAWSPPDGLVSNADAQAATVSPTQDTEYHLTVTSPNGCTAEASTLVFVIDKMHIPNSFSPNNDGHNDTFQIYNAKDQIVEMRIYNRWGELIFYSPGYEKPWDGTYKNEPVPAGSYPYIIKTEESEMNGTILLLK